jgi:tRNA 5-methylaminomethyl-2-thiouridine biosynthesis bifunctional protein
MTQPPRSTEFDDVYFSADGGPEETLHVFLNGNNLPEAWQGREKFTIGETGYGTGLNFLLAWELFDKTAAPGAFLDFLSVEKFPMSAEEIREGLAPWADRLEPYLSKMLDQYPIRVPGFHRMVFDNRVALTLIFDDANDAFPELEGQVDAWFLDGFTPSKNPDMWTDNLFSEMARLSHGETTFATFTAAGFVKRGLQAAGFHVEKTRGFGRKRDMMIGAYKGVGEPVFFINTKEIGILGAGLAGCASAYVLKQYGFNPVIYDPNGIASGASGNPVGMINPRFSAFRNAESDFYTAAFAQAVRSLANVESFQKCGALHLLTDDDKRTKLTRTAENWKWHSGHMRMVEAKEASNIAGVELSHDALYLNDSAKINPSELCQWYVRDVEVRKERAPDNLEGFPIYANGVGVADKFSDLPLHTVRGQISYVKSNGVSRNLKTNISYGGYITPENNGIHVVGSTFQKWLTHTDVVEEDHIQVLDQLSSAIPTIGALEITGGRAALRTSSQDRFPVIGLHERVLISTAHGSHGIASSLMGAHLIADILRGGIHGLGKSSINALCPGRFAERAAKKRSV